MKINHMLVSTIPLIFVNNATRSYTTYMYLVITECRISDLMYVSRGQRKASSAAKLSDICSYFWHRVLLQNLPNKIISILLDKKLCYTICLYFYYFFHIFVPLLSVKVENVYSGLFLYLSIRPRVRLSLDDIFGSPHLTHILTPFGLKKTPVYVEVKGQGNKFLYLSHFYFSISLCSMNCFILVSIMALIWHFISMNQRRSSFHCHIFKTRGPL